MDFPEILSSDYVSVEGTVEKYIHDSGELIGGRLSIEGVDGKSYRFIDIDIPSYLEKGDWVKVDYWKYSRVGAIVEINGVEHGKLTEYYFELTLLFIVFLLLGIPFYSFRIFKWKPFFNRKEDYSIFVYQDLFTQTTCVVQIIMLQGAQQFLALHYWENTQEFWTGTGEGLSVQIIWDFSSFLFLDRKGSF